MNRQADILMRRILGTVPALVALGVLLAGCAEPRMDVPPPRLAVPRPGAADNRNEVPPSDSYSTAVGGVTHLEPPPRAATRLATADWSERFPSSDQVTVAVQAMPLKDFVHYSFGELLKVSYVLLDGIPGMDEPVTLNVQKPVSSRALYKLTADLLATRKVGINYRDGVYYLAPLDEKGANNVRIGYGRRPSDVPEASGRILQIVPLRYGISISIERTVRDLVNVQIMPDANQGAYFVTGEREAILRVLDIIALLDQPANRARQVGLLRLTYIGSKDLGDQLVTILENEGIPAGIGHPDARNVALVPLEQLGAMVVFASSAEILERVEFWVRQLDKPSQGPEERYFIYYPKNARALDLGDSLAPLVGAGGLSNSTGNRSRDTRSALGPTAAYGASGGAATDSGSSNLSAPIGAGGITNANAMRRETGAGGGGLAAVSIRGEGLILSVDPHSNTLIFFTTGSRYQSLLPVIRRLDVPPKQILLEATIAEVTLTGQFAHGVEFAFSDGKWNGGTSGQLGLPTGGLALNYIRNLTDNVKISLTANNSLVNILSNPTLVVRDGVQATIDVGNDVPTVGATATDPLLSSRTVTSVLYRKTGLSLQVRPTINAEGLVVLEIAQTLSETTSGSSGVSGAPIFFERNITTEVVARSGQSVLLAGLISEQHNRNSTYVPGLGKIPGLGWLFSSETKNHDKTELVVLITPRVIENPDEWAGILDRLRDSMEGLALPASGSAAKAPNEPPTP
jgi:general secretion pathway protein D